MQELSYSLKEYLAAGLKPGTTVARNQPALLEVTGAFPWSGSLVIKPSVQLLDVTALPCCEYPYPQIFVLRGVVLVCTEDTIYEYAKGPSIDQWLYAPPWELWEQWGEWQPNANYIYPVLEGLTPGTLWSVADFQSYLVLTNGKQTVIRDGLTMDYSVVGASTIPNSVATTAVGGQVILGAPYCVVATPNIDKIGLIVQANLDATASLEP